MRRTRASSVVGLAAILCALALVAGSAPASAHEVEEVDEWPDDPHVCGGTFFEHAECLFVPALLPLTLETSWEADEPDTEVFVHGQILLTIPETPWSFVLAECYEIAPDAGSCTAEVGPPIPPIPLTQGAELICHAHVHPTPPGATGEGQFRCATGGR